MKESMQSRLTTFDRYNRILMKKYWTESAALSAIGSATFVRNGKEAEAARMDECKSILNRHFGIFSNMRGLMKIPLLAEMACREDPEGYITQVGEIYKELLNGRVFSSEYEVLCATMLYDARDRLDMTATCETIMRIYKKMRKNHPLLTSREDMPIATLFALADKDEDALLAEMEACYKILKPGFFMRGEQLQTLCAILATQEEAAETKCERVQALCDALKKRGCPIRWADSLPIVAGLCGIDRPVDELADEIGDAEKWLRGKKGFGFFRMGKPGRVSFAMLMTLEQEIGANHASTAFASATLTSVIIAEIILSIIIVCMIVTRSHSSSSAGNS